MESIAIIGMGCRFPSAKDPESFWHLLKEGKDLITEVPPERWDIDTFYNSQPSKPTKMSTRWGSFIENVDQFDANFFGISPREAQQMDPQQRLVLEVAWEALENSAIMSDKLAGSQTGVFVGVGNCDYDRLMCQDLAHLNAYSGTGTSYSIVANRLSYLLDLRGPSITVDTACSASLVAIHLACLSLHNQESHLALAGGVNLILSPHTTIILSQANMMAPDGRCKTFDAGANGYVRGEGCGILVLKRFSDALKDENNILAVIRGSAVNQDGLSNGFTAPNGLSQQAVIRQALENALVQPAQISYLEAHGTGTSLGDPIEFESFKTVLMQGRSPDRPCWIGSVKTNVGHLESAAGVASLIKVILSLQHREIPPHLHLNQLNRYISLEGTPFCIPTKCQSWSTGTEPRLAGVSGFSVGGTNCHIVLEEAPTVDVVTGDMERPLHILTLSAKSEKALQELAQSYDAYFQSHPETLLADVCFTANTGRSHFTHRLAVIAESNVQLQGALGTFATGENAPKLVSGIVQSRNSPKIAFLFTGQGSQYVNMGRQLYETQPTFRRTIDLCDRILSPDLEQSLLSVLYPELGMSSPLHETVYTQPALFALEYALAELWKSWGIVPDVVMGHSVGEYVAACVSGVFSLEDGLKLIVQRAQLMEALPKNGMMVAVFAPEAQVVAAIQPYSQEVAIAAINGPENIVISGKCGTVEVFIAALKAEGIKTRQLNVSHAFHSPLMEPMLAAFEKVASEITFSSPKINVISNVTGGLDKTEIVTPEYWCHHVRQPVRFAAGMETLAREGYQVFIEIGPKPTLLGMGRSLSDSEVEHFWLPSMRPGKDDWQQLLQSLGELYISGVKVDWSSFDRDYHRRHLPLPTYTWQRQRYWIEATDTVSQKPGFLTKNDGRFHPLVGQRLYQAGSQQICFESQIRQKVPAFLGDKHVYEKATFPATGYLEMAYSAGVTVLQSDNLVVAEVLILHALILPEKEAKTIQLILTFQEASKYFFQIFSLNQWDKNDSEPSWTLHATGKVLVEEKDQQKSHTNLAALEARCSQKILVSDYYQQCQERSINYGATFQALECLWKMPLVKKEIQLTGEALGKIRIPEALFLEAGEYKLHPVLLDACFQVVMAAFPDSLKSETYLLSGLERLRIYCSFGINLWSYVQLHPIQESNQQTLTANIYIYDETGAIVAQVEQLSLKKTSRELLGNTQKDLETWLYRITWQPKVYEENPQPFFLEKPGSWLIFADAGGIGVKLAQLFKERGDRCLLIFPGQAYENFSLEHYYLNPSNLNDFQDLFSEMLRDNQPPCRGIVHLWSLEKTLDEVSSPSVLQKTQVLGCGSVLHIIQALVQAGWSSLPHLSLITKGSQPVGTSTPLQVQQAPLWGLGRVIDLEHSDLHCMRLDLDPLGETTDEAQAIFTQVWSPDQENQIAYRQGTRYVARLQRTHYDDQVSANQPSQHYITNTKHLDREVLTQNTYITEKVFIQKESSYLITGGLGALGLQVAQWLVEQGARHLVLTGRHDASNIAQKVISQFENAGIKVLVVKTDVSHFQDVASLLETVKVSMPLLRGVVHAAGILDDGILLQQNWERFQRVMAPKVEGVWNLHTLTQDLPLDFFVCFSSIASLFGSLGQGNYAAANAFMDALVHHRRALGLPGLSINWGPWAKLGMAAALGDKNQEQIVDRGLDYILPIQGLQILSELLRHNATQVAVQPMNWSKWLQTSSTLFFESFVQVFQQPSKLRYELLEKLKATPAHKRRELLTTYVSSQVAKVLGLTSPEQILPRQRLFDLGIDSLMAVDLKNWLDVSLGQSLRSTLIFDYPTVEALVNYLALEVLQMEFDDESRGKLQNADARTELSVFLDSLSQDEIADLLGQEIANTEKDKAQ
ncbi:MAG: type I polyketide synthase [Tolypothrix brevis GSE-NOS-MK-07-07A]|jgi:acyl transferase domain-containing protein/acyl carrier protein|nr:type I polyketide synthase [Tolypothrix brevis GSE-NOS-MK-07-07A]